MWKTHAEIYGKVNRRTSCLSPAPGGYRGQRQFSECEGLSRASSEPGSQWSLDVVWKSWKLGCRSVNPPFGSLLVALLKGMRQTCKPTNKPFPIGTMRFTTLDLVLLFASFCFDMGVSENSVPHCTQWFCWSLSLLNGYFIGDINPTFSGPNPYCLLRHLLRHQEMWHITRHQRLMLKRQMINIWVSWSTLATAFQHDSTHRCW